MSKACFLLFVLCFFSMNSRAQSVGLSALYNMQSESSGLAIRAELKSETDWQFVPQFSYFLPFNQIHEWTIGLAIQRNFWKQEKWNGYCLGHLGFNRWINNEESKMKNAQPNNWNAELGLGMKWGGRTKPFIEWRYNVRFQEAHWQLGLLFRVSGKGAKKEKCAAYN